MSLCDTYFNADTQNIEDCCSDAESDKDCELYSEEYHDDTVFMIKTALMEYSVKNAYNLCEFLHVDNIRSFLSNITPF